MTYTRENIVGIQFQYKGQGEIFTIDGYEGERVVMSHINKQGVLTLNKNWSWRPIVQSFNSGSYVPISQLYEIF